MKLSIIIPAYNEENGIEATLGQLESYMQRFTGCSSWEIIAVNDGSSDNTLAILNNIQRAKDWLKVVDLGSNYGRGRAVRSGFEEATGDVIITLDADLSYAPYHIDKLVDKLVKANADIVVASAYCKGGTVKNVPFIRMLISRLGNKFLSYTFGGNIAVLTCIVRGYRKAFIEKLDLHSDDKDLHLEILHKAKILGARIEEIPADLHWNDEKLASCNNSGKRRSTLRLRKTSNSHFFFAMMSRPGIVYFIPANILLLIAFFVLMTIAKVIMINLANGTSLYLAIRNSMIGGTLSWMTFALSIVLSIQFFSLGFLTNQNKKNYEEMYKTTVAILTELRKKKKE